MKLALSLAQSQISLFNPLAILFLIMEGNILEGDMMDDNMGEVDMLEDNIVKWEMVSVLQQVKEE